MSTHIGLDIGGTKIMVAATDGSGRVLCRAKEPTPLALGDGLGLLHELIDRVREGQSVGSIGAAIGGPLDHAAGVVSPLHQPQWRQVPLKKIMEERWHCPFRVDVDTNAAALGEYRAADPKPKRLLYVTVSTGMGGGWVVDGSVDRGSNGAHAEIAHQSIAYRCRQPDRIICECGATDCLEALVSGNGIRRIYGKPAEELDETEWAEVGSNLGQGLRNLATILVPDEIVLGGGVVIGRGQGLLESARASMRAGLKLVPEPRLRLTRLGYDTALHGAIALAIGASPSL